MTFNFRNGSSKQRFKIGKRSAVKQEPGTSGY
jgi:hypothetical protein